jgi:hypothetical protein
MTKGHIGNIFNYFFTLKRNTIGSFLRLRGKNTFVFSLSLVYFIFLLPCSRVILPLGILPVHSIVSGSSSPSGKA